MSLSRSFRFCILNVNHFSFHINFQIIRIFSSYMNRGVIKEGKKQKRFTLKDLEFGTFPFFPLKMDY